MTAPAAELQLQNVTVIYAEVPVLQDLSLTVAPGETVALLGASGSGKSTLLRVITGLEQPTAGRVILDGVDITKLAPYRRGIGFVFQSGQLFSHRTVGGNIAYGLEQLRPKLTKTEKARRVQTMLELVHLAGYENRKVSTLSGGQAQRVALARALAPDPQLMLLDEPLSALDAELRVALAAELKTLLATKTAILVTHDPAEAAQIADRVVQITDLQAGSATLGG